jgi:hypothetical protein
MAMDRRLDEFVSTRPGSPKMPNAANWFAEDARCGELVRRRCPMRRTGSPKMPKAANWFAEDV